MGLGDDDSAGATTLISSPMWFSALPHCRYIASSAPADISPAGSDVISQKERGKSSPGRSTTRIWTTRRPRDQEPARYSSSSSQLQVSMSGHLNGIEDRIEGAAEPPEDLKEEVEAFREALEEVQDDLNDAGRGAGTWGQISRATNLPTANQLWQIDRSWEELPAVIERVNEMLATRLPALFDRVLAEDLQPELGDAVAVPVRR